MIAYRLSVPALFFTLVMLGSSVPVAHAQNQNTCFDRMTSELVTIHDEWRSRLFGSRRGTNNTIVTLTGGETDDERTGIFETKNRLTSELIEPIVDSYRVYRCRSLAVCQVVTQSINIKGGAFDLKLLGCAKKRVTRYGECYFAGGAGSSDGDAQLQSDANATIKNCQDLVTETLAGEKAILRLAVAYDTGYRSLLQLSGMVDWMLEGFPTETVKAVSNMVNMLGKLHQIPCFIGQCDNPDTENLEP